MSHQLGQNTEPLVGRLNEAHEQEAQPQTPRKCAFHSSDRWEGATFGRTRARISDRLASLISHPRGKGWNR